MAYAYARGYVERAGTPDDGPIRFVAANEGDPGDGIDLRMTGARLDRFRANPVFGFGHRYGGRDNLPIGRAVRTEIEGPRLLIDVAFDQGDPFAKEVERKYREGFLNAVSIGFEVHEFEDQKGKGGGYFFGGVAIDWELLELSAVPIPADANAVVAAGRETAGLAFARGGRVCFCATHAAHDSIPATLSNGEFVISAETARRFGLDPKPESDEAEAEVISPTAREALLTAFSLNPEETQ